MKPQIWLVFLFCLTGPASAAGAGETLAGRIREVHAPAYWRRNAAAPWFLLKAGSDVGRKLYSGQEVRCERGGSLRLRLYGKEIVMKGPASPYRIPAPVIRTPLDPSHGGGRVSQYPPLATKIVRSGGAKRSWGTLSSVKHHPRHPLPVIP